MSGCTLDEALVSSARLSLHPKACDYLNIPKKDFQKRQVPLADEMWVARGTGQCLELVGPC